jgi:hypothetical protein
MLQGKAVHQGTEASLITHFSLWALLSAVVRRAGGQGWGDLGLGEVE